VLFQRIDYNTFLMVIYFSVRYVHSETLVLVKFNIASRKERKDGWMFVVSIMINFKSIPIGNTYFHDQIMQSVLTWNTMCDRLSSSRSSGSSNCSFLPFKMNTGLSLGNTKSRVTSLKGSPTIGSSAGLVLWLTSATQ